MIKSYFTFWGKTPPFSKNWPNMPSKQFFTVFLKNTDFFEKIVE